MPYAYQVLSHKALSIINSWNVCGVVGKYVLLTGRLLELMRLYVLDKALIMLHTLHVAPINAYSHLEGWTHFSI